MEPSHRTSSPHRFNIIRANTWPTSTHDHRLQSGPTHLGPLATPCISDSFEEQLDANPSDHFLSTSTMDSYEDPDNWSSDSSDDDDDDDDDEIEWNAGITDFALFDSDRRRARETGQAIPQKWNHLLSSQASALGRSVERTRAESVDEMDRDDTAPGLTPDVSPHLADDLTYHSQPTSAVAPSYLTPTRDFISIIITPPTDSAIADDDDDEDGELRLAFFPKPVHQRSRPRLPTQRPGLSRGSRTLSGRLHVWRRPSLDSHSVLENPTAELSAELEAA